jgi:hypothetical protein
VPWLGWLVARLSPLRPMFAYVSFRVGFEVDKVALGQVFSWVLGISPSISFHCVSPYAYIIWRMNINPVGGGSSVTFSHIDMNNKNNIHCICLNWKARKWILCIYITSPHIIHSNIIILYYIILHHIMLYYIIYYYIILSPHTLKFLYMSDWLLIFNYAIIFSPHEILIYDNNLRSFYCLCYCGSKHTFIINICKGGSVFLYYILLIYLYKGCCDSCVAIMLCIFDTWW